MQKRSVSFSLTRSAILVTELHDVDMEYIAEWSTQEGKNKSFNRFRADLKKRRR